MQRSSKVHALLSTARVANIPSVVVNVWLGISFGLAFNANGRISEVPWGAAGLLALAGILLYVAGNFLNDWMDRDWDAERRPERALPCGLFKPAAYLRVAILSAAAGLAMAACVSLSAAMVAIVILICIVGYTRWHKRNASAVVLMGMCRAGLVWLGALGVAGPVESVKWVWIVFFAGWSSIGILCYISGLSLGARLESVASPMEKSLRSPRKLFVFVPVAMIFPFVYIASLQWMFISGVVPYASWIVFCEIKRQRGSRKYIPFLLAGIPLVDWVFLLPLAILCRQWSAEISVTSLVLPPIAFVAALLLQRLAPAT
jgi:4-hydroxybenzoate polyprenyltransferase